MKKFIKASSLVICILLILNMCLACTPSGSDGTSKVTFNQNYIGAPTAETVLVDENDTVAKPSDPTRSDYIFGGWFTNVATTKEFSFETPIVENTRLFAKWVLTNATVTFNSNNGSSLQTVKVGVGETVGSPSAVPTKNNNIFVGWYSDALCRTPFDFSSTIEKNTVIYAKWQQTHAAVNFYIFAGEIISSTVSIGQIVARPETDPTRADYVFTGWYKDVLCTIEYDFSLVIDKDTVIYAGWASSFAKVTVDLNYEDVEYDVNASIGNVLIVPEVPLREGYTFEGWYRNAECLIKYDFSSIVNDSFRIYANWTINEYTVFFQYNIDAKGVFTTKTVEYMKTVAELTEDPSATGYIFKGWYAEAVLGLPFNFETMIKSNTYIYAQWAVDEGGANENPVNFYLNNGTNTLYTSVVVEKGRRVTAPTTPPTRTGDYYFAGWTTDPAGTTLFNFSSVTITATTNLYAKWFKRYTFEAEYTYLTGKPGQGTSDNPSGLELISDASSKSNGAQLGVSNDNFVSRLYYNGAFIDFEINSSKAVNDAVIILRLTSEWFDYYLDDKTYQVVVNGTNVSYGDLSIIGAIASENGGDHTLRPFSNFELAVKVNLKAGANTIRLLTNNSTDHQGTYTAETPFVDCIYVCTDAVLAWEECHPENIGKTMDNVVVWKE